MDHPQDQQLENLFDALQASHQDVGRSLERLRQFSNAPTTSKPSLAELTGQIGGIVKTIDNCQKSIREIEHAGVQVPAKTKDAVDVFLKEVRPLAVNVVDLLSQLERGEVHVAVQRLQALLMPRAGTSELGQLLLRPLPFIFVGQAESLVSNGKHEDALRILTTLDLSHLPETSRSVVPALLEQSLAGWRKSLNPVLVQPDGTLLAEANLGKPMSGKRVTGTRRPARRGRGYASDIGGLPRTSGGMGGNAGYPKSIAGVHGVGALLMAAVDKCVSLDPSRGDDQEMAYDRLLGKQLSGKLTRSAIEEFTAKHPGSHTPELQCWCGINALARNDRLSAKEHFAAVTGADPVEDYYPLATLGLAITRMENTDQELLAKVALEQEMLRAKATRTSWSQDIERLFPTNILCSDISQVEWLDQVTLIRTLDELESWKGHKNTIPWVRLADKEPPTEVVDYIRRIAADGGVAFVGSRLFRHISRLRPPNPDAGPTSGECVIVQVWAGRPLNYPFLNAATRLPFKSNMVFSVKGSEKDKHLVPLMAFNNETVIGAIWAFPKGGAVILLPDYLEATVDANRFIAGLVAFSTNAAKHPSE